MNPFEKALLQYLKPHQLERIQAVRVGIAGAGGLGSNCAFNLVRCGFKRLLVIDFDVVEPSNLNRQFYFSDQIGLPKVEALAVNLKRINPDLELEIREQRITADNIKYFFEDCQVVVEAFDRAEDKLLLVEHLANKGKLLVGASGLAGYQDADAIVTHHPAVDFFLIGDLASEVSEEMPPLSPRVNIAAAKQANVILKWVLEGDDE